jgi:inorganic pyrophosphatase
MRPLLRRLAPIFAPRASRAYTALLVRPQFRPAHPFTDEPHYLVDEARGGGVVSAWHGVPLHAGPAGQHNVVVCTRAGSDDLIEAQLHLAHTPLAHSRSRRGEKRFLGLPAITNLGFLPQTWALPAALDAEGGGARHGGPLDVCEVGGGHAPLGAVLPAVVVGALGVVDEGHAFRRRAGGAPVVDWKLLALRANSPLLGEVRSACSAGALPPVFRMLLEDLKHWLVHEGAAGGATRRLVNGGEWAGREKALQLIEAAHGRWAHRLCAHTVALRAGAVAGGGAGEQAVGAPWLPDEPSLPWTGLRVGGGACAEPAIAQAPVPMPRVPSGELLDAWTGEDEGPFTDAELRAQQGLAWKDS